MAIASSTAAADTFGFPLLLSAQHRLREGVGNHETGYV